MTLQPRPRARGRLAPGAFVLFAVLLVLAASATALVVVYGAGERIISARERAQTEAERDLLKEAAVDEGLHAAQMAVERRSKFAAGGERYGLYDPKGHRVAGDLEPYRPGMGDTQWHAVQVGPPEPGLVHLVSVRLRDGYTLAVGRDLSSLNEFVQAILLGFLLALAIVAAAGFAAGLVLNAMILQRVDAIAGVAERIASGDLSARAPLSDRRDPFGRVGASLNAMLSRIEELMTGMRTVTDSVAHDLRSPLTRMKGALARALHEDVGEAERLDAIEAAHGEADHTLAVLSALLDIARAEAGLSREMMSPVDLAALTAELADFFAPVIEDAGQTLTTAGLANPVVVVAHEALLRQAAGNLIHNASQHAGAGARVEVRVEEGSERVRLIVSDTGRGVPSEARGRVQERFVRLDPARSGPGAGLGLAIAAACAKLHGGVLRLEDNAPGLRAVLEFARLP